MKNRTCKICEDYERLRSQAGDAGIRVEKERPIAFICAEHGRFLLFGPTPKTRHEVDQLAHDLKRRLGLSKTPGPKAKKITVMDIARAYEKIPGAGLLRLAEEMDVSTRKIQDALKEEGETFTSFKTEFLRQRRKDKSHISLRFKRPRF